MTAIRVLLADDHAVLRDSLKVYLDLHPDLSVVGEAVDGVGAVSEALRLRPDVLLLDLSMPGLDGVEVTCCLKRDLPACKIVILSQYQDPDCVLPVLKAGANGYLLKKAGGDEVVQAIRTVHRGEAYLHPAIAQVVLEFSVRGDDKHMDPLDCLSPRELEVLTLIGQGLTNQAIAELLSISRKTVDKHRSHLIQKLQVSSRAELIHYALQRRVVRWGALPPTSPEPSESTPSSLS
ncbi:MAG: response regulator transcription factor [Caldilineaceae bacterium]|nr:response regulator transcription factor [Caldilineaceae bacterium]